MNKHYHFIGIGGVGMGAIASLLLAKGVKVSGSDLKENKYTTRLKEEGAAVHIGHSRANVEGCDCVVYSSAISASNPEIVAAREAGVPVRKRAEVLAELLNPETGITVAGAHGKTTTSSMVSYLLIKAGLNPTTMVGGITKGLSYNANLGGGKYFVTEVDESDGSFLFFTPQISIITNIDFEHVDYYHSWENILKAYGQFIERTKKGGLIIACGEDERLKGLLSGHPGRVVTYGFLDTADLVAKDVRYEGFQSSFQCVWKGNPLGRMELKVPGRHNVLNALAACAVGLELKIDFAVIRQFLSEFEGVERRFQLKGEVHGIRIVDDYGHHPSEIAATLAAARTLVQSSGDPGSKALRLITVFQPHRYSRTKFLMDQFAHCFSGSDELYVTDIYAASEPPIAGINSTAMVDKIKAAGDVAVAYLPKQDIVAHLTMRARPGDLILTLGAGDITKYSDQLVKAIEEKYAAQALKTVTPDGD